MDWEKLTHTEREIILNVENDSKIYPDWLAACHKCANDKIDGTLTEEKAKTYFMPVVKKAISIMYSNGWRWNVGYKARSTAAKYIYKCESDEMIAEMMKNTETYTDVYYLHHERIEKKYIFEPGKNARIEYK